MKAVRIFLRFVADCFLQVWHRQLAHSMCHRCSEVQYNPCAKIPETRSSMRFIGGTSLLLWALGFAVCLSVFSGQAQAFQSDQTAQKRSAQSVTNSGNQSDQNGNSANQGGGQGGKSVTATSIAFYARPDEGSNQITVLGDKDATVYIYQFDPNYAAVDGSTGRCGDSDLLNGVMLSFNTSTTTSSTATSTTISASTPITFTLTQPLVGGTQLCLVEWGTVASGSNDAPSKVSSRFVTVNDPTDYGRVAVTFTGGTMVTNQQTSSNSSTAAEYVDLELDYAFMRPGRRPCTKMDNDAIKYCHEDSRGKSFQGHQFAPGFEGFFNARLSSFPVATQTTNTTTTTNAGQSTGTSSSTTNLNQLTSQQGLIIATGAYLPFRTRGWFGRTNAFGIGPVVKASFDTTLNPSVSSGTTTSTSTTTTISSSVGNFSPVYSSWAMGTRLTWDQYPVSTDKMSNTWMQIDATMGEYSNLQSYDCVAAPAGGTPSSTTATACGNAFALKSFPNVSRTLFPRVDIAGFAKFPNYPVVLGFDANLAQYSGFLKATDHIDFLNKPGNDVRIYLGVRLDLWSVLQKIGLSATPSKSNGTATSSSSGNKSSVSSPK